MYTLTWSYKAFTVPLFNCCSYILFCRLDKSSMKICTGLPISSTELYAFFCFYYYAAIIMLKSDGRSHAWVCAWLLAMGFPMHRAASGNTSCQVDELEIPCVGLLTRTPRAREASRIAALWLLFYIDCQNILIGANMFNF